MPEAVATILSATDNSHVKKTIDLVFFCILVFPNSSWPNLTAEINFNSNDMVTHGFGSADLCAAVPAPASTREAMNPPWVIPAALRWFSLIFALKCYSSLEIALNRIPPLCFMNPGLRLICSNSLLILF